MAKPNHQVDDLSDPPLSPILPTSSPLCSSPPASKALLPPPTTTTSHPSSSQKVSHWKSDTRNFRIQGWDPVLIISQILAIQALHYLALSLIVPPMLAMFADPVPAEYEGGPRNVAMIIDWRAMVGRTTLHVRPNGLAYPLDPAPLAAFGKLPASLGRKPFGAGYRPLSTNLSASSNSSATLPSPSPSSQAPTASFAHVDNRMGSDRIHHHLNLTTHQSALFYDPNRSWVISIAWFVSSLIGVIVLYKVVGRPKQIMDHSLTIGLNHLILTTYYSARLPTSMWFYVVLIFSAIVQTVLAEQLCVRREFRDGLGVGWKVDQRPDDN